MMKAFLDQRASECHVYVQFRFYVEVKKEIRNFQGKIQK